MDLEAHGLGWVQPDVPLAHPLDGGRAAILERDVDATAARRAELASVERPAVTPTEPSAATWLEREMRDGDEYLLNPA